MTNWIGTWELIPGLLHHSAGGPPESGTYEVAHDGDLISIAVNWVSDGQLMSILQINKLPQTGDMTIFQVYRRIA